MQITKALLISICNQFKYNLLFENMCDFCFVQVSDSVVKFPVLNAQFISGDQLKFKPVSNIINRYSFWVFECKFWYFNRLTKYNIHIKNKTQQVKTTKI